MDRSVVTPYIFCVIKLVPDIQVQNLKTFDVNESKEANQIQLRYQDFPLCLTYQIIFRIQMFAWVKVFIYDHNYTLAALQYSTRSLYSKYLSKYFLDVFLLGLVGNKTE